MEKIAVKNLTFSYPLKETPALDNINFTVHSGEFITVCGKSGCGKSTLLRQLKPIISPHGTCTGSVYFDGAEISSLTPREQAEKIGFVMQSPDNQIVCDKVWHELAFGLESLSYPSAEIRAKVAEMASFFGIQDWFYKNVTELSGGQKQLLNLASVMVMQPSLLILDEPTSQLDPIAAHEFFNTVKKINQELGTTVILSEHRLEEAFPISDRVIVMESGKIIADGEPRSVGMRLKEINSDMLSALPTPMRVYYSVDNDFECPVTVREGRQWLLKMPVNKNVDFEGEKRVLMGDTAVDVRGVWFRYEKDTPDILKNLSFKVRRGEFYAIVGGNGAGKTTALSLVAGINKPYRGTVKILDNKKTAALPQNPQSLFVKKTLLLDLYEIVSDSKEPKETIEEKIQNVIKFCELEHLTESHPYDLSGGEQQRAALAKVLLTEPDILLLDEPTKGLDAHFKEKLAAMLKNLQSFGVTVIMVSHDIEFCAKYADRLGMFFDGKIVSEDEPRKFFSGKSFYTTAACRMAGNILPGAVLDEDITAALGVAKSADSPKKQECTFIKSEENNNKQEKKSKLTKTNIAVGCLFAVLFCAEQYFFRGKYTDLRDVVVQIVSILFLGIALLNLIPRKDFSCSAIQEKKDKRKIAKRTAVSAFMILLLIPLTIFFGIYYLGDRKYYFISMLIILETILPFLLVFESRRPRARELVVISVLCAIGVAGRAAFSMLPQFKPVAAIVIIAGICFGGETGFLVGAVTGFVSNFFFSQGPWTPWQMFSFGIIGFFAGVLFQKGILRKNRVELCIFGFLATLVIYGGIMNPASVIMYQENPNIQMLLASYVTGLPFDLVHAASTSFFLWFAAQPMCEKLDRIKIKYGLNE